MNDPKSDRLLVLTSEASQSVIFKVDYVTVLNAVLWISESSVYKILSFSYFGLACLASLLGDNKCGRGADIRDEKPRSLVLPIPFLGSVTGITGE